MNKEIKSIEDSIEEVRYEVRATKDYFNVGIDKLQKHIEELKQLCKELRGEEND